MMMTLNDRVEWRLRLAGPLMVANAIHFANMGDDGGARIMDYPMLIDAADELIDTAISTTPPRGKNIPRTAPTKGDKA
jgi:hypothetical protein